MRSHSSRIVYGTRADLTNSCVVVGNSAKSPSSGGLLELYEEEYHQPKYQDVRQCPMILPNSWPANKCGKSISSFVVKALPVF